MGLRERLLMLLILRRRRRKLKRKFKRKCWVRKFLTQREQLGDFKNLLQELKSDDREQFFRFLRMSPDRLITC